VTRLPVISGDEFIKALQKLVCHDRSPLPVPKHKELGRGVLRKIIRTADITIDEFIALLKE
jgi:predicted RNA binding protein YcfA (HicA-like mRNA interferase family)